MNYANNNILVQPSILPRRYFSMALTFIAFFLLSTTVLFSQTIVKNPKFGAILLTKEQYALLPRINWDTLKKYSDLKTISSRNTKSVFSLNSPPVGDQGDQNSCVGWACGYAALGTLTYPKYDCWNLALRSPSFVFNQINQGCNIGAYLVVGVNLISGWGSCSLNSMPYNENDCNTWPTSTQFNEASKHTPFLADVIYPSTSVNSIQAVLDLGYPVVCGFDIYASFMFWWTYGNGIIYSNSGGYLGSHAACIVGYDNVQQMFKVQNSWGIYGGDNGFFWVSFDMVANGFFQELYVIGGMNPNYPGSISGSSPVCFTGNIFTISDVPSWSTISWDHSTNLSLSSAYGDTAIFTASNNGVGWVRATINNTSCNSFELPTYNLWVGSPGLPTTNPSGNPPIQLNDGDISYIQVSSASGASINSCIWDVSGSIAQFNSNPTQICAIETVGLGEGYFSVISENECGISPSASGEVFVSNNWQLSVTPNPASSEVVLKVINDDQFTLRGLNTWDFDVFDQSLTQKIKVSKIINNSYKINVQNWLDGIYIIRAKIGNRVLYGKLIVTE